MTINELIDMAEARVRYLQEQRNEFQRIGDAANVARVDAELVETAVTLASLRAE